MLFFFYIILMCCPFVTYKYTESYYGYDDQVSRVTYMDVLNIQIFLEV